MIPGLVSVTFRRLKPRDICELCEKTGLKAVEWGGDIHVPPEGGNAGEVRRMSADAGLDICSYGSYFRVGQPMDDFRRNLDAACELGAPIIRVWCGDGIVSANISEGQRARIVEELVRCGEEACRRGVTAAPEFHGGTLTDSVVSVERLLAETQGAEGLRFYWQPRWDWPEEDTLRALELVRPRMAHAHVFTWRHEGNDIIRLPLSAGESMWKNALPVLGDCYTLIEFVKDDSAQSLAADAETIRSWMAEMNV